MRRFASVAFFALLTWTALAGPALAAAPTRSGWWSSTSYAGLNLGGTDVPAGDLLVQSDGGAAPLAYAAVGYSLSPTPGESVKLTLEVAANSATTPSATLEICPLDSPTFVAASGGPTSQAPSYNCSTHAQAAVSANGKSFSFDLGDLVNGGPVAVAILPAGGVERVVIAKPGVDSLSVASAPTTTTTTLPFVSATTIPQDTTTVAVPPEGIAGYSDTPSTFPALGATPDTPATTTLTTTATTAPAAPPTSTSQSPLGAVAAGPTGTGGSGSASAVVAAVAVAGLVLAGGLWAYAGASSVRSAEETSGRDQG